MQGKVAINFFAFSYFAQMVHNLFELPYTHVQFLCEGNVQNTKLKVSETIFFIVGVVFFHKRQQNVEGMTWRRRKLPNRVNRDLILVQHLCQTSCGWQLCSCACWYANTLIQNQLPRPGTSSQT